ncbi:MAG TPA: glycosyltransferase family 39 protein [Dehalococcoidia bacterium]|nr:glycosyltransferase family 39 protein [Dehalococcoidia bacterium]
MASIETARAGVHAVDDDRERLRRELAVLAAVCALVAAVIAVAATIVAHRSPITSDESLYLSEALNIAKGIGPRYTTHDFVQHRPFLFPALIALPMKLTGGFGGVYWFAKAIVVLDAAALGLLVSRMFGRAAGLTALVLALSSRFLAEFGTTVYLDSTETLFLLLMLLGTWEMRKGGSARLSVATGVALALAFLTKEASLLWFPLPALFVLLTAAPEDVGARVRGLGPCYVAFTAAAGWWWVYVWQVDGRIYLWPYGPAAFTAVALAALGGAGISACAWMLLSGRFPVRARVLLRAPALVFVAGWVAVWWYVQTSTTWPQPYAYLHTIPAYLADVVAGNAAPWPLFAAAVLAMFVRTRSDARYRLLALAFALWLPFAIVVANLGFALRDLMPMMYLAYAVAAVLVVELLGWLSRQVDGRPAQLAVAAIIVIATGYVGAQSITLVHQHASDPPANSADWNNALVRGTADWIETNIPAGTPIISSRRYFSQLYVLTDARYPIEQLPTVNVVPEPGQTPYLQARSTLFRWQDTLLPPPESEQHWISVDAFASKHYYTALSQEDLLRQIAYRKSDYLVLSGEDVAFSSTRYVDYFSAPAFTPLHHASLGDAGEIYVFRIDRTKLALRPYSTVVPASVLNSLYAEAGGRLTPTQLLDGINPAGVTVRPGDGLSPPMRAALGER